MGQIAATSDCVVVIVCRNQTSDTGGEDMSDIEVANNIFKSGVSSAQQVTSISGRGVGMDVVRAFLKQHGCLIDIVFTGPEARGYRPFALRIQLSPKVILTSTTTNLKAVNIAS